MEACVCDAGGGGGISRGIVLLPIEVYATCHMAGGLLDGGKKTCSVKKGLRSNPLMLETKKEKPSLLFFH